MKDLLNKGWLKEVLFQFILLLLIISVFVYDEDGHHDFQWEDVLFFLNYFMGSLFINYILLPKFYYKKRYWEFVIGVLIVVALVIFLEEGVLEQIFYPDSRGHHFPGVIIGIMDTVPIMIIFVSLKFAKDILVKQSEIEQLKAKVAESELQFLKSQVNPHFLFNNLNNLYSYALESSPKTPEIILKLSSLMRYMLYECKAKYVPLSTELKHLEAFVLLQELQIENRGNVCFQVKGESGNHFVVPLILIVFVENSFKHSMASQSDQINIDIQIEIKDERLYFVNSNSFSSNSNNENLDKGIGLKNVKARLDLLYPNAYKLDIKEDENEFKVELELILNTDRVEE